MGIDAMALLRIPKLKAPPTDYGTTYLVYHRGDCSLLYTMNRYHGAAPDEHALALRQILGPALDAHDDPRGILIYPDVCEPSGKSYDAIVAELDGAGVWAPKVDADYVPDPVAAAAHHAQAQAEHESITSHVQLLMERSARGEPLISQAEMNSFFTSDAAKPVLESFGPGLREQLQQLDVDFDALPDDDLGKQMATVLGLTGAKSVKKRTVKKKPAKKKKKATAKAKSRAKPPKRRRRV